MITLFVSTTTNASDWGDTVILNCATPSDKEYSCLESNSKKFSSIISDLKRDFIETENNRYPITDDIDALHLDATEKCNNPHRKQLYQTYEMYLAYEAYIEVERPDIKFLKCNIRADSNYIRRIYEIFKRK